MPPSSGLEYDFDGNFWKPRRSLLVKGKECREYHRDVVLVIEDIPIIRRAEPSCHVASEKTLGAGAVDRDVGKTVVDETRLPAGARIFRKSTATPPRSRVSDVLAPSSISAC
jgi:hypothetical protein